MNKFKVSVLIPIHSTEFLQQTLESLNLQVFDVSNVEILLILDRIDVREIKLLLDGLDENFTISIFISSNPGIVPALNLGLSVAQGEFVARIDQDDLMLNDRLAVQVEYLDKNQDCLAVGSSVVLINEANQYIGVSSYPKRVLSKKQSSRRKNPMAHPSVTFRREAVLSVGGYKSNLPEDWELWLRLADKGKVRNLYRPLTIYRVHDKQMSRNFMYQIFEARQKIEISRFIYERFDHYAEPPPTDAREWIEILKQNGILDFDKENINSFKNTRIDFYLSSKSKIINTIIAIYIKRKFKGGLLFMKYGKKNE